MKRSTVPLNERKLAAITGRWIVTSVDPKKNHARLCTGLKRRPRKGFGQCPLQEGAGSTHSNTMRKLRALFSRYQAGKNAGSMLLRIRPLHRSEPPAERGIALLEGELHPVLAHRLAEFAGHRRVVPARVDLSADALQGARAHQLQPEID